MNKERVEMLKSSIAYIMRQMESVQYEIACGIIDSATAEEKVTWLIFQGLLRIQAWI